MRLLTLLTCASLVQAKQPNILFLFSDDHALRSISAYGGDLANWLDYGASPRATIALDRCSRAMAWLQGRDFVTPDDIRAVAHDVLRHRLILSFDAEASGVTANQVIDTLLETVSTA